MLPTTLSAFNPSPKRKRDPPRHASPLIADASTPPPDILPTSGSESPRNRVADQLRELTIIQPGATVGIGFELEEAAVRKKIKRGSPLDGPAQSKGPKVDTTTTTPDSELRMVPLPPSGSVHRTIEETPCLVMPAAERRHSPAPSGSRKKSPSPPADLSSLTWQDSEITGHLADPSIDPEDDGTGLNGIGFRPTPALAYARAQRRRQQVLEWRTREAREARQRRYEQRRRGSSSVRSGLDEGKDGNRRTVRFAA